MRKEVWKPVVGYEGLYEVSSKGGVRSLMHKGKWKRKKELVLKPYSSKHRYLKVRLYCNGSSRHHYVHRLIAVAFLGPSELTVNHKDGVRTNNILSNLEWLSMGDNNRDGASRMEHTTSRFVGVSWDREKEKWVARIGVGGKHLYLGCYEKERDARSAYLEALGLVHLGKVPASAARPTSSKYTGVCWNKGSKKWQASIRIKGKLIHLGYFFDEVSAAKARRAAEKKYGASCSSP